MFVIKTTRSDWSPALYDKPNKKKRSRMDWSCTAIRAHNTLHKPIMMSWPRSAISRLLCRAVEIAGIMRLWKISLVTSKKNIYDNSKSPPLKKWSNSFTNIFTFTTMRGYNWKQDRHPMKPGVCSVDQRGAFFFCLVDRVQSTWQGFFCPTWMLIWSQRLSDIISIAFTLSSCIVSQYTRMIGSVPLKRMSNQPPSSSLNWKPSTVTS